MSYNMTKWKAIPSERVPWEQDDLAQVTSQDKDCGLLHDPLSWLITDAPEVTIKDPHAAKSSG